MVCMVKSAHGMSGAPQGAEKEAREGAVVPKNLLPRFPSLERLRLRSQRASLDSPRSLPAQPPRQQQLGFDAAEAGRGSASPGSSSGQSSPRLAASYQGQLGPAQSLGRSYLSSRLSSLTVDLRRADLSGESGAPGSSTRPSSEQPRCAACSSGLLERGMSGQGVPLAAGLGAAGGSLQRPNLPPAADMQLSGTAGDIGRGAPQTFTCHVAPAAQLQPSGGADGSTWGDAQPAAAPAAAVSRRPQQPQLQSELRAIWSGHPAEGAMTAAAAGRCPDDAAQPPQLQPVQQPVWTHRGWRTRVPRVKRGRHRHLRGDQRAGVTAASGPAGVAPAAPPVVSQAPCCPACTGPASRPPESTASSTAAAKGPSQKPACIPSPVVSETPTCSAKQRGGQAAQLTERQHAAPLVVNRSRNSACPPAHGQAAQLCGCQGISPVVSQSPACPACYHPVPSRPWHIAVA